MMTYELWDTEIGKYLGQFTEEQALLTTVKTLIDHYGPEGAEWLSIGRRGESGTALSPLTGDVLLAWMASFAGAEKTLVASSIGDR